MPAAAQFAATARRAHLACQWANLAYAPRERVAAAARASPALAAARVLRTYDGADRGAQPPRVAAQPPRDAQALLAWHRGAAVVAFRGTQNRQDLADALDIRHARMCSGGSCGRVHRGFFEQFMAVERMVARDLCELLDERGGQGVDVWFTGHSMGAGAAAVAAAHFASIPALRISCYTFGAPHLATAEVVRLLHDRAAEHLDVQLEGDPVPLVPIHPDFRYPAHTLVLAPDGTASCRTDPRNRTSYADLARMLVTADDPFKRHACSAYVDALAALRARSLGLLPPATP